MFATINAEYATKINAELDRLTVGTDADSYSGLMAQSVDESEAVVKVFDDYDSGEYYADQILAFLESLSVEDVNLQSDSPDNIWQAISKFKV